MLTLMNLSLGVIAILLSVKVPEGNSANKDISLLIPASLFVMVAALTDRFDGKVARMLDAATELGKELDSLSDLVSFGVAPVIIAWKLNFMHLGVPGYLVAVLFPIAVAYRLARYNVTAFDNVFRGIPITIAGAFLAIDNLYNCFAIINNKYTNLHSAITILLMVILSYLMVSNIKIKKI